MSKLVVRSVPLVLALVACDREPVIWNDAAEQHALVPADSTAAVTPDVRADSVLRAMLRRTARGVADTAPPAPPPSIPGAVLNGGGTGCVTTVRVAAGRGGERAAAWWAARPNGSAVLLASRSGDGGATWDAPARVDTLDVGAAGCERPAPSVAVDSANGYVHVAYAIEAPEGTGVFYAHRMGPTLPFERPQVIVYGDHVTRASVASAGDLVAVAYEDPNTGGRPCVSLALSRTAGHSWAERFVVSSDAETAERPAVALRGREVAVGWMVPNAPVARAEEPGPPTAARGGMVVVRVGRVR
ncbi:hypothetical protein J421_2061 [Gemmatirosa kalamazoonensis]|uniref:Exo-alpha-sialidase n=1 Tax=Gemmatirosa kalamazoonensis TaxID=861299 RepID=W0RJK5_9BACT|nr:sialidase family protein [Gemmatirosa kalamazoonensis]AHG89598.1 hypothetical protein J421_2061 [Gemmatirosa kalamazoonensis]